MQRRRFLRLERDHELRTRVRARVTGMLAMQVGSAYGQYLDDLAAMVEVRRRILEDEA